MRAGWEIGVRVRFRIKGGDGYYLGARAILSAAPHSARITTDTLPMQTCYLGEGFYHITTIPDQRKLVAHEDDLVLDMDD